MMTGLLIIGGLIVGSFLNVCIYRLPREQSISFPRSRCPKCQAPIAWYDNIPVLSFIWLGARCRHCRAGISWQYPVVELLTAAMGVWLYRTYGLGIAFGLYAALAAGLIVSTFVDLEHQIIPDEITLPGMVIGLVASALYPALHQETLWWRGLLDGAVGLLVGGGSLYLTGLLGNIMFRKESMGGGDIKLLAMVGSLLGWQAALLAFALAPVLALAPGVVVLLRKGSHLIPYGPFLSAASLVSMVWGQRLIRQLFWPL